METPVGPNGRAYAGFWRRVVAYMIDTFIVDAILFAVAGGIFFSLFMNVHNQALFALIGMFAPIVFFVATWLYYALMESSEKQATLGKMAIGLVVTDLNGNRLTFGRATGRFFAKIISSLTACIGYLIVAFTEKKQALHDIIANTLVLQKRPSSLPKMLAIAVGLFLILMIGTAAIGFSVASYIAKQFPQSTRIENIDDSANTQPAMQQPAAKEMTKETYLAYFAAHPAQVSETYSTTVNGMTVDIPPGLFDIPSTSFDIETRMNAFPNSNVLSTDVVQFAIDRILDTNGKNIFDDTFLNDKFFQQEQFTQPAEGQDYLSALHTLHVQSPLDVSVITEISGKIILWLPGNTEYKDVDLKDGTQLTLPNGETVTVNSVGSDMFDLEASKTGDNLLSVSGLDTNDAETPLHMDGRSGTEQTTFSFSLSDLKPTKIRIHYATTMIPVEFPFVLPITE